MNKCFDRAIKTLKKTQEENEREQKKANETKTNNPNRNPAVVGLYLCMAL